jgi:hypothetical protein
MPFVKGKSGNPAGAPKKPHKLTLQIREIAREHGPSILKKLAREAKAGDVAAARIFVSLLPRSKLIDTPREAPPLASVAGAVEGIAQVVAETERGRLDLDEAQALIDGAKAYVEATRTASLEVEVEGLRNEVQRLMAFIEQKLGGGT